MFDISQHLLRNNSRFIQFLSQYSDCLLISSHGKNQHIISKYLFFLERVATQNFTSSDAISLCNYVSSYSSILFPQVFTYSNRRNTKPNTITHQNSQNSSSNLHTTNSSSNINSNSNSNSKKYQENKLQVLNILNLILILLSKELPTREKFQNEESIQFIQNLIRNDSDINAKAILAIHDMSLDVHFDFLISAFELRLYNTELSVFTHLLSEINDFLDMKHVIY